MSKIYEGKSLDRLKIMYCEIASKPGDDGQVGLSADMIVRFLNDATIILQSCSKKDKKFTIDVRVNPNIQRIIHKFQDSCDDGRKTFSLGWKGYVTVYFPGHGAISILMEESRNGATLYAHNVLPAGWPKPIVGVKNRVPVVLLGVRRALAKSFHSW